MENYCPHYLLFLDQILPKDYDIIIKITTYRREDTLMFFIGFFGTNFKVEQSGYANAGSCPCCHSDKPLHIARRYNYFHAFLIPLFKFGSHYFATCPNCASVFEADDSLGERAAKEGIASALPGELHLLQNNYRRCCPNCGKTLDSDDRFCRNCGTAV